MKEEVKRENPSSQLYLEFSLPGLVERLYVGPCMLLLGSHPINIGDPLVKVIMVGGEPKDPGFLSNRKFFKNGPIPASFSVYFRLFNTLQFKLKKA